MKSSIKFLLDIINKQKKILLLCFAFWSFTIYIIGQTSVDDKRTTDFYDDFRVTRYLIYNNKCKMADFKIWHYGAKMAFRRMHVLQTRIPSLVNMHRKLNRVYLNLAKSEMDRCTACLVQRNHTSAIPDKHIEKFACEDFNNTIEMMGPTVDVVCYRKIDTEVYHQVFANYVWPGLSKCPSVYLGGYSLVIIGIDSVSKFNFKRTLPKTYGFLVDNNWTEFVAFNKIGLNSLPNLFGLLTGNKIPSHRTFYDGSNFIWDDYRNAGYVTSFIEDFVKYNTFIMNRYGFKKEPTDFYFRPYVVAYSRLLSEGVIPDMTDDFRFGGQLTTTRILDLVKELPMACEKQPYFGFFWLNNFSHDFINGPQLADDNFTTFFKELKQQRNFDNTIIIFMADHGFRRGRMRRTVPGWYEDMLPFLFIHLPESLKQNHPEEYKNFLTNSKRLVSAYDLYIALQDVLVLSNITTTLKMSKACPTCNSIFRKMPEERSCSEAGIPEIYCSCITWNSVYKNSEFAKHLGRIVVEDTQKIIASYADKATACQNLSFFEVQYARISSSYGNITKCIVGLETIPFIALEAHFSINISEAGVRWSLLEKPTRIDSYKYTGYCVDDHELKKYCFCGQ